MKFYCNNPCEVIREISSEFSEIKVFPKFADSFEGSSWCTECMAGHGYSSHTCEPYQDVIDAINDTESSMIVITENRLLHDEPVEFAKWITLRDGLVKAQAETKVLGNLASDERSRLAGLEKKLRLAVNDVSDSEARLDKIREDILEEEKSLSSLRSKTGTLQDSVKIGGVTLSLSSGQLRELITSHITLEKLKIGGVEDWEWHDASMGDIDVDDSADDYISSLTIKSID